MLYRPIKRSMMFFGCCKQKADSHLSIQDMDEAIQKAVSDEDIKTIEQS